MGNVIDEGGRQQTQHDRRDRQEQQETHPIGREAGAVDGAEDAGAQSQKRFKHSCRPERSEDCGKYCGRRRYGW